MEAVPKLPMIYFELKISPVCPDFATPFKRFIGKHYSEDGNSYEREIHELETLRNKACRAPRDFTGCSLLKRYYSQIYSLQNRFSVFESNVGVECVWADIYSGQTIIGDLDLELACVLYNIGALHAELGALDLRNSADNMKVSCTHFQCAVWAFQHLRDDNRLYKSKDMSHDLLSFFVQVMLSQAQECILEKSMLDNRKSSIVAKVAAQVVEYYSSSLLMLLQSAINTSANHTIVDIVGSKIYKEWKKFIEFKVSYYNSICALFMGNLAEEQQKMGERVAWFQSAEDKLNEAIKMAKQMDRSELSEALNFVSDVIDVKLGNAKKENDFVYHEKVPTNDKLNEVKGVSLVKGIPFSVCDPEISGADIFARLVPIEAHETASIYSAKKDEIMRTIGIKIDDKNQELAAYMSSLQIDRDSLRSRDERIPDELIEVCAAMSVNPDSVNEVNDVLAELEEISGEVDRAVKDTKTLLEEEDRKEKEHQSVYGKRPTSMIVVELSKELAKHEDTHKKALLSNSSLRDNLERHCDDVKLLISSSAQDVASLLPSTGANVPFDESNLTEMEKLLEKVDEMKNQRQMLEHQLKDMMATDDIMKQVLAHNRQEIEEVFANEIKKYDRIVSLIEQNLSAQDNILRALTKANAKYSETRRAILDNQRNRSARIASLIHTFEVFKELQSNSKKGFDFYQKFQNIVARLQARTRGVCRVQDEERAQISLSHKKKTTKYLGENNFTPNGETSVTPKLKDYLPFLNASKQIPNPDHQSGPIPAANLMTNNYLNMVPPAQNYPPSSLAQISYNHRIETPEQHPIQPKVPQMLGQLNQPSLNTDRQTVQPSHQTVQPESQPQLNNHIPYQLNHQPIQSNNPSMQPYPQPAQQQQQQQQQYVQHVQYQQPVVSQQQPIVSQPQQQPIPQQYSQQPVLQYSQPPQHQYPQPIQTQQQQPIVTQQQQQPFPQPPQHQYQQPIHQQYHQPVQQLPQQYPQPYQQPIQSSFEPQYQSYGQQFGQHFQQPVPSQTQQTYQQSYEQPLNQQNYQQYSLPVQQQMPPIMSSIGQTVSQPMSQSLDQTIPQCIPQSMPQPIQPFPQPMTAQPIQQPMPTPAETKSEQPSNKPESDLLKQFDPLFD